MRSEAEMYELILRIAQEDERIRAVILNGSRLNPNAPKDFFQDFDIIYLVTDVAPYKNNIAWIDQFGERMILQMPEEMEDPPANNSGDFVYLTQFQDGNRLDLSMCALERLPDLINDSLTRVLLDKDGRIPPLPEPSDADYWPVPPTAKQFFDCCNEFWWVSPYVAKALWRDELTNAKAFLEEFVREELMKMLDWYVGVKTGFQKSTGKHGKYLRQFLEPELWEMLLQTYPDADPEHIWQALLDTCDLFRAVALVVADHFEYEYPYKDDRRVTAHLQHVHRLPRDATGMY